MYLPVLDENNPFYTDYGVDPYWDIQLYNQHEIHFYGDFNKEDADIEPDCPVTDRALNDVLIKELLDPWQTKTTPCASPAQDEPEDEFPNLRPQVSLTTAVEARFVITLVTRNREPDYVPLTTNLDLKYKRRMLYFPIPFGELTLDGFVDTGALSSAIPDADLRKIRLLALSHCQKGPSTQFQNNGSKWAVGNFDEHCRTEI